jgi:ankyrin repeat protein
VFLEFKALLNVPAVGEGEAFTPIYLLTRNRLIEATKLLLSNSADLNVLITEDITPLHLATSSGIITELDLLLDWGASINA